MQKTCKSCRSRQELSNEYLLEKIRFDTAENEPLKVCQKNRQKLEKTLNHHRLLESRAEQGPVGGRGQRCPGHNRREKWDEVPPR